MHRLFVSLNYNNWTVSEKSENTLVVCFSNKKKSYAINYSPSPFLLSYMGIICICIAIKGPLAFLYGTPSENKNFIYCIYVNIMF